MSRRKRLFDTIRKLLGRGFRQHEVDQINAALDHAGTHRNPVKTDRVSVPVVSRTDAGARQVGEEGIALIKRFEGCARLRIDGLLEAYPDPGTGSEPWTIGWGSTGSGIDGSTIWTQEQADARLEVDLARYAAGVAHAIGDAPTSQAQFDALVSFHYNTGAIGRATLTKKHVAGDYTGATREFTRWNKAGGKVLKGLVRRRTAEAKLYSSG